MLQWASMTDVPRVPLMIMDYVEFYVPWNMHDALVLRGRRAPCMAQSADPGGMSLHRGDAAASSRLRAGGPVGSAVSASLLVFVLRHRLMLIS